MRQSIPGHLERKKTTPPKREGIKNLNNADFIENASRKQKAEKPTSNEAHNIIDCITDTSDFVDARKCDIAIRNDNRTLHALQRPKFVME